MGLLQIRALLAVLAVMGCAGAASAGPVEQACMASDRASGNASLCGCVQKVADVTLTGQDQRLVAQFFLDPDKAERVRMDPSASANAFWQRYTQFGEQAEMACQN